MEGLSLFRAVLRLAGRHRPVLGQPQSPFVAIPRPRLGDLRLRARADHLAACLAATPAQLVVSQRAHLRQPDLPPAVLYAIPVERPLSSAWPTWLWPLSASWRSEESGAATEEIGEAAMRCFKGSPKSGRPVSKFSRARRNRGGLFRSFRGLAEIGEACFEVFAGSPKSGRHVLKFSRARRNRGGTFSRETRLPEIGEGMKI